MLRVGKTIYPASTPLRRVFFWTFMHPSMSHRAAEQMQRDMQSLSPAELEAFEERAAIMEFTGGATREFAESKAMLLTLAQRTK